MTHFITTYPFYPEKPIDWKAGGKMGLGVMYRCPDCKFEKELNTGNYGYYYGDRLLKDLVNGEYGTRPLNLLTKHPYAYYEVHAAVFHCSCGNYESKDVLTIDDGGKRIYSGSMRCPLCGKKMWELSDMPWSVNCIKCGTKMEAVRVVDFD